MWWQYSQWRPHVQDIRTWSKPNSACSCLVVSFFSSSQWRWLCCSFSNRFTWWCIYWYGIKKMVSSAQFHHIPCTQVIWFSRALLLYVLQLLEIEKKKLQQLLITMPYKFFCEQNISTFSGAILPWRIQRLGSEHVRSEEAAGWCPINGCRREGTCGYKSRQPYWTCISTDHWLVILISI